MQVPDATLEKLKKAHGRVFMDVVELPRGLGTVEFVRKAPRMPDWLMTEAASAAGAEAANNQMLGAVVLFPERSAILEALRPYPVAVAEWFEQQIGPTFGAGARVENDQVPGDDEATAALRAEHGDLMRASITLPGADPIPFTWRAPVHGDWEASAGAGQGNSSADLKALMSVVVDPDPTDKAATAALANQLKPLPIAVGTWVRLFLMGFFGQGSRITSTEL